MTRHRLFIVALAFVSLLACAPRASAAIAFVEGCHGQNGNDIFASATCTISSTSNLLVIGCHSSGSATNTFTADDNGGGHSATQSGTTGTQGNQRGASFTMTPPATGSVTFKCTSSAGSLDIGIVVAEYSGNTGGNTAKTTGNGTTSPATSGSITLDDANDYIVNTCGSRATGVYTAMTAGTLRETDFVSATDRQAVGLGDNTAASGAVTVAFTLPGGDFAWECEPLELKLTSSGAVVPRGTLIGVLP